MSDVETGIAEAAEQREKWAEAVRMMVVQADGIGTRRLARLAKVSRSKVLAWRRDAAAPTIDAEPEKNGCEQDQTEQIALSEKRERDFSEWFNGAQYGCACPACNPTPTEGDRSEEISFDLCHTLVAEMGDICPDCRSICP